MNNRLKFDIMNVQTVDDYLQNNDVDYQDLLQSFGYQENLTARLDSVTDDFTQTILNEIVLWKVNRYAEFSHETIKMINSISPSEAKLDVDHTGRVLDCLLATHGVGLPMASTILRFKDPSTYQIIDRRAYRVLYGEPYRESSSGNKLVSIYMKYLHDLRVVANNYNIPFEQMDRFLYQLDKMINSQHSLTSVETNGNEL